MSCPYCKNCEGHNHPRKFQNGGPGGGAGRNQHQQQHHHHPQNLSPNEAAHSSGFGKNNNYRQRPQQHQPYQHQHPHQQNFQRAKGSSQNLAAGGFQTPRANGGAININGSQGQVPTTPRAGATTPRFGRPQQQHVHHHVQGPPSSGVDSTAPSAVPKKKQRPSKKERLRMIARMGSNDSRKGDSSNDHAQYLPGTPPETAFENNGYFSDGAPMALDEGSYSPVFSSAGVTPLETVSPYVPPEEPVASAPRADGNEKKKRKWKPYSQMTWEDKLAIQQRQKPSQPEVPQIPTDRKGKRRKDISLQDYVPLAPRVNHFNDDDTADGGPISIMSQIPVDVVQTIGLTPMMSRGGVESFFEENALSRRNASENSNEESLEEERFDLTTDPAVLLAHIESQNKEIASLKSENEELRGENSILKQRLGPLQPQSS